MTCPHCRGLLRRDEDGVLVCWICSRAAGPVPVIPLAVPKVTLFRYVPAAPVHGNYAERLRIVLRELLEHPGESQTSIAERLNVPRRTVSRVALRYGLTHRVADLTHGQATYRDILRRAMVGGKAEGKTHVAGVAGKDGPEL